MLMTALRIKIALRLHRIHLEAGVQYQLPHLYKCTGANISAESHDQHKGMRLKMLSTLTVQVASESRTSNFELSHTLKILQGLLLHQTKLRVLE